MQGYGVLLYCHYVYGYNRQLSGLFIYYCHGVLTSSCACLYSMCLCGILVSD